MNFITLTLLLSGCGFGINLDDNQDNDPSPYPDDCNDRDPAIYPDAQEILFDGTDQNCNGVDDEDFDGDGQTVNKGDCDDKAPYIFSGALEFRDGENNDCDSETDENNFLDEFVLWASQNDYPSTTVSVIGTDFDRDSYTELLVGDTEGNGIEPRSGLTHLIYGGAQEEISYQSLWGSYENDRFGSSLAYLDFEGNGTYRLAIGAKGNDDGGTSSGSVALFSSGSVLSGTDYDSAEVVWYGAEFTYAGSSLATSDSNNNQKEELLVGAYGINASTGAVYLLDETSLEDGALEEKAAQSFYGEQEESQFGWALSGGVDLDGDGIKDFAVGAPQDSHDETLMTGAVYIYLGGDGSYPEVYQSIWYGEGAYDNAGYSLATGDDVDGDGYADLLVGAPGNDDYGLDAGRAYLVGGGSRIASSQSLGEAKTKISGGTEAMQIGLNVAMAGDVNADSYGDILLAGMVDDELSGVSAGYLYLGDELETEMTTSQANAVFVSNDKNLALVANGIGHFDGQYYDSQGPYADFSVAYSDPTTNETLVHLMLGQETK